MVELSATPSRALEDVFRSCHRDLLRTVVPLTGGDRAAAEDVVAEAFACGQREWGRVGGYDRPVLRRRPRSWLVAAAAAVVALGVAAVVVASLRDDDPTTEVTGAPEGASVGGTVAAPPGDGTLLPDGTRIVVTTPAGSTWEPDEASATLDLAGLPDPRGAVFRRGTIADLAVEGIVVERDLGGGRALVVEEKLHSVAVAHDGWVVTVDVATDYGEDEDIPADAIDRLARGLAFDVTSEGPIDLRGPGVTVIAASRSLRTTDGTNRVLRLVWNGGRPVPDCDVPPPSWRCTSDGTVLVEAGGGDPADAEDLAAAVTVHAVHGVDLPQLTETATFFLPTRQSVDLALPVEPGWSFREATAEARVDGVVLPQPLVVTPVEAGPPVGPLITERDGADVLLVERDGWRVVLPLPAARDELVGRARWEDLRATLRVTTSAGGVTDVQAEGLELFRSAFVLGPEDGSPDRIRVAMLADSCTPGPATRCLMDATVVATADGEGGLAALRELWLAGTGAFG